MFKYADKVQKLMEQQQAMYQYGIFQPADNPYHYPNTGERKESKKKKT